MASSKYLLLQVSKSQAMSLSGCARISSFYDNDLPFNFIPLVSARKSTNFLFVQLFFIVREAFQYLACLSWIGRLPLLFMTLYLAGFLSTTQAVIFQPIFYFSDLIFFWCHVHAAIPQGPSVGSHLYGLRSIWPNIFASMTLYIILQKSSKFLFSTLSTFLTSDTLLWIHLNIL